MFEKEVDELKLNLDKAIEYREKEEYKLAIESLYKALDVQGDNVDVLIQLAEIYSILKDYERSIKYYKSVLEVDENNLNILGALYSKYFIIGKFKDALECAQKALNIEKNDKNYLNLIKVLDKFSDVKALRDLVAQNQLSETTLIAVAHSFVKHAFPDDAINILNNLSDSDEKNVVLAQILFNKNEFEQAKSLVMSSNIESVVACNLKGLFYIEEMKFIDAIKSFSKAIMIDPSDAKLYFNLATAYFHNGWMDEAVEAYKKAIELDVTNVDYRFALASLYFEIKDYVKARQEVANICHIDSEHIDTNILIAQLKFVSKDFLGAKNDLENILKVQPDNNFVKTSLAKVLIELKLYDKAENLVSEVLSVDKSLNTQVVLADLYAEREKYSEALDLINELLAQNGCYMPAFDVGMKVAYKLGDLDLTQKFAQEAISVDINFAQGYYYLGLVRFERLDFDEALECLKRAIMYDLTNPKYYAQMAKVYADFGDIKSALDYANEAISIDSSSAEYMVLYSDLASQNRKICLDK